MGAERRRESLVTLTGVVPLEKSEDERVNQWSGNKEVDLQS
jgi:hypothetical protein